MFAAAEWTLCNQHCAGVFLHLSVRLCLAFRVTRVRDTSTVAVSEWIKVIIVEKGGTETKQKERRRRWDRKDRGMLGKMSVMWKEEEGIRMWFMSYRHCMLILHFWHLTLHFYRLHIDPVFPYVGKRGKKRKWAVLTQHLPWCWLLRRDVEMVVTRFPLSVVLQFTFSPDRCCFHTEPGKNTFVTEDLV